jgi:hypothetical protein
MERCDALFPELPTPFRGALRRGSGIVNASKKTR